MSVSQAQAVWCGVLQMHAQALRSGSKVIQHCLRTLPFWEAWYAAHPNQVEPFSKVLLLSSFPAADISAHAYQHESHTGKSYGVNCQGEAKPLSLLPGIQDSGLKSCCVLTSFMLQQLHMFDVPTARTTITLVLIIQRQSTIR